ncbi:interferon gamma 1 [Brienomyrus brachyistius]|uniref:interferon gamma 1 n=1 Tax=Brienomyrus brachyistius TaxID=42636 RepID=UPI0020B2CD92|nr:interferon gamma 1 [Brienomyrus brachyistius]
MVSLLRLYHLCGIFVMILSGASSTDFISHNMREDLRKMKEYFKTNEKSLFHNPIFLRSLNNLENFKDGEQGVIIGEVLEVYVDILSRMMNSTTDPDMKVSISHTRSRLETLMKNHFPNTGTLKAHLQELWAIAPDNLVVQRKAIQELLTVFNRASLLGSKLQACKELSRRKRQTRTSRI